jgi:hypothetical protein
MATRIPIGRNDLLEIGIGKHHGKTFVHLNVLTSDNLRGFRRTKKGFTLDGAMLPFIFEQIRGLIEKENRK